MNYLPQIKDVFRPKMLKLAQGRQKSLRKVSIYA